MKKNLYVSVSTDPIKEYQSIAEYAKEMQGYADFLHCDVMDGKFVENKTYDASLVDNINQHSLIMLDVHLMTQEPYKSLDSYISAGANIITFHYEAAKENTSDIIKLIHSFKIKAGLSIKPKTFPEKILKYLPELDMVLIMTVEPGFGGQKFMPECAEKISVIKKHAPGSMIIQVDGGINAETARVCTQYGANSLVAGNYIYKSENIEKAILSLR